MSWVTRRILVSGWRRRNSEIRGSSQSWVKATVAPITSSSSALCARTLAIVWAMRLKECDRTPERIPATLGELDPAVEPAEEGEAQLLLEAVDLPADRGLRHAELARRLGEAQAARGRLEHDERASSRGGGVGTLP